MMETKNSRKSNKNGIPSILNILFLVAVVFALITFNTTSVHGTVCGDVNIDNMANVGDVVYILSYVFKGGPPPEPLCAGDVNGDGEVNVGDAVYMINWIFRGGPPPACMSGGEVVHTLGCKSFWKGNDTPPDQDCIEYQYDGAGYLAIKHVNAGFNCCPGEILADIIVDGNTITIVETETQPSCYCLCLFDVDIDIYFIPPGQYTVHVVELYLSEGDEPLEFTVDLSSATSGSYCVPRDYYPWSLSGSPSGHLVEHSSCKNFAKVTPDGITPPDQDCIAYQYDGGNTLLLRHINAGFNCCPTDISANFSFVDNTIVITEMEELDDGGCDCLCLFDCDYEISDLNPGEYTIRINGLYLQGVNSEIEITVDLTSLASGQFCVQRNYYPWGIW